MMLNTKTTRERFERIREDLERHNRILQIEEEKLEKFQEDLDSVKTAKLLLTTAAIETQKRVKSRIEDVVSEPLEVVFDRPSRFELDFDSLGGRLTCTPLVRQDDITYYPRSEKGGSIVSAIAFSSAVGIWLLEGRKSRPIFVLDEPFTALGDGDYLERMMSVLRRLVDNYGIQIIIITHIEAIANSADHHIIVRHNGSHSTVHTRKKLQPLSLPEEAKAPIPRIRA